jgi:cytochrome c oxidase assembly protein Cox11
MKLPDANSVAPLLHDWDDKRLNTLSAAERKNILATIDNWAGAKKLPMIEGEENFVMIKEGSKWKVFLDWAAGAQVQFAAALPAGNEISAEPTTKETVARSGDSFTIGFKVANPTAKEIVTRIVHRVEPKELAPYLDLVECALLLPVRVRPGEEQLFNSTYLVRGDLPDGVKTLKVTYEFKVESN